MSPSLVQFYRLVFDLALGNILLCAKTTQTQNKRLVTAMVESATVNCFQSFTYSQQLALFTRLTGRLYNSTKLENWLLLRIGSSNSWTLCPSAPNWGQPTRQPAIPTYLTAFSFCFLSLCLYLTYSYGSNPVCSPHMHQGRRRQKYRRWRWRRRRRRERKKTTTAIQHTTHTAD